MLRQAVFKSYSIFQNLGLEARFSTTSWRRRRLLILCWHGISLRDEHDWCGGLYISPELFRERLRALERGKYNVLPLHEALERLRENDLPPQSVAITFDDGFYDFAAVAAPALDEFGFPSTVYLTTFYVNYQRPIPDLMLP